MKIIGISNGRELPQQVYLIADSAIIRTNKPFFVPHFAKGFTGNAALVLHIDRLGRHIAPRFAHRYCHAIAPAVKVTAHDIELPQQCEQFSALAHSFDGALLLGDSTAIGEPTSINGAQVAVERNGEAIAAGRLDDLGLDYQELIARLSHYFTLKMGDMIVVELGNNELDINIGDTINASINGSNQLTIRVK